MLGLELLLKLGLWLRLRLGLWLKEMKVRKERKKSYLLVRMTWWSMLSKIDYFCQILAWFCCQFSCCTSTSLLFVWFSICLSKIFLSISFVQQQVQSPPCFCFNQSQIINWLVQEQEDTSIYLSKSVLYWLCCFKKNSHHCGFTVNWFHACAWHLKQTKINYHHILLNLC